MIHFILTYSYYHTVYYILYNSTCIKLTDYNLESQGNTWNLQKRALYVKFYPEMP